MQHHAKSIRPFIGSRDFEKSRNFYRDLGFEESEIDGNMSYFHSGTVGFYLQNYYAREWIENLVVFLEVDDVRRHREELTTLNIREKYAGVRISEIHHQPWGSEYFVHDPSGVLWHFGQFNSQII